MRCKDVCTCVSAPLTLLRVRTHRYDVQLYTTQWATVCNPNATQVTLFALSPGAVYLLRLRAANANGTSPWTSIHFTCPAAGAPGVPTQLAVAESGGGAFTVRWCPALNDGGSTIVMYRLRYRRVGAPNWTSVEIDVEAAPRRVFVDRDDSQCHVSYQVQKAVPHAYYQLRVQAVNAIALESDAAVLGIATGQPSHPSQPRGMRLLGTTGGSITVEWEPPADTGGVSVTQYRLNLLPSSGHLPTVTATELPMADRTTTTVFGLANDHSYSVRLVAVNAAGLEGDPVVMSATTRALATAPGQVTALRAIERHGGSLVVAWEPPSDTGGFPLVSYTVTHLALTGHTIEDQHETTQTVAGDAMVAVLSGLVPLTRYQVTVTAHTAWESGPAVTVTTSTTPVSPPSDVFIARVNRVSEVAVEVTVHVNDTGGLMLADVQLRVDVLFMPAERVVATAFGPASLSVIVSGLAVGGKYHVVATAESSAGQSVPSPRVAYNHTSIQRAMPVRVVTVHATSMLVEWDKPPLHPGEEVASYQVRARTSCGTRS